MLASGLRSDAPAADRALRAAINDPLAVEADSTARIIAALKRANKSKPVILLDSNASIAKAVARKLCQLGFRSVHIVEGGFDGRGGWVSSGLSVAAVASQNGNGARFPGIPGTVSARK
jgi:rhodanese-related sulfurtransferase